MRIIGGKLRHRIIDMTNLETTRETQDKVRGAIFNMIGPYLEGDFCLDLFAGSGAMGIEAYSRGINNVIFNDINNKALDVCKSNCKKLGINDALFYNNDYLDFLNNDNHIYDLIILDPPYKMDKIDEIITLCVSKMKNGGRLVFEMGKETHFEDSYLDLVLIKNKEYGIKRVVVYEKK